MVICRATNENSFIISRDRFCVKFNCILVQSTGTKAYNNGLFIQAGIIVGVKGGRGRGV